MPSALDPQARERALAGLREAQRYIVDLTATQGIEQPSEIHALIRAEIQKAEAKAHAMIAAVLLDEPVPVSFFRPWASRARVWQWERGGQLKVYRANGKTCLLPSEFFALWRRLCGGP